MRVIILGCGVRGRTYLDYALAHPDEYEVVGVADPCPPPVAADSNTPKLKHSNTWQDALASCQADAAIIALPDKLHKAAAVAALEKGLHVLLEKPLGCSWAECEEIRVAQRRARRLVLTGYVLRFAPYYRALRDVLRSGVLGEIVSLHHLVAIGHGKAAHAFCRGNWAREADGTSTLVQKCTHDFDLIEWWTGSRRMRRVASFGSLTAWRPERRPDGSDERCADCPAAVRAWCPYDAHRLYIKEMDLRYHFADTSDAAMERVVAESRYGRCVYAGGNDAVDHQTVLMEYDGGLTATLEMEGLTKARRRVTHFYGTRGEIVADGETIEVRPFVGGSCTIRPEQHGAHGGGDREIMASFARLVRKASPERYAALLDAALESHRIAFLAESSRQTR